MRQALKSPALLLAGCLLLGSKAVAGEPAVVADGTVTLEMCLQRGLAHARQKGLFDAEVAGARAGVDQSRAQSSIQLNATPGVRYTPSDGRWQAEVQANLGEQLLEIPQNRVRQSLAAGRLTSFEFRRDRGRNLYAAGLVRAFAVCLRSQQDLELAEERLRVAEQAATAWGKLDAVTKALVERREKALVAARDARAGRDRAGERFAESRRQLGALTGLTESELQRCRELPDFAPAEVPLDRCLDWAREHRSDLARARHEAGLMEQAVSLARMERWPRPKLTFGYNDNDTSSAELLTRLVVEVPLWDAGRTKAKAAELSAQHNQLRLDAESLLEKIVKEVTESHLKLRAAAFALQIAAEDPLPGKDFRLAEVNWKNGEISQLEFEQARLRLFESRALIAQRRWDCLEAETELLDAMQAGWEDLAAGLPSAAPAQPAAVPAERAP